MPSLPVSICAHQREVASKIKTESKTLLYDSITSALSQIELAINGETADCISVKGKDNAVLAGKQYD